MSAPDPDFEIRVADWLAVEEALTRVLGAAVPLPREGERVSLTEALGRALAEDLRATATLPPWDNSAMDGYAVRGDDVAGATPAKPVLLRVTGVVRAGDVPSTRVEEGEAIRIMTGAPVPPGADSVVRREDTDEEADAGHVRVFRSRDTGKNVRPGGEDLRAGDLVLEAGATITPGTVGLLAALGRSEVLVHPRPRVAILATGDELRPADRYDDVRTGAGVPDSNGPMLAAAVTAAGGIPLLLDTVPDRREALAAALESARDADMLVTIGGASLGEADLVKSALEEVGFELDFWRVLMRPGSPFSFGHLPVEGGRLPVFGLPGNPSSAFVTFELFARPFMRRRGGHRSVSRHTMSCRAGERLKGAGERTVFTRVSLDPSTRPPTVHMTGPQGSGLVRGLAATEALAVVPAGSGGVEEGAPVEVILLGEGLLHETGGPLLRERAGT